MLKLLENNSKVYLNLIKEANNFNSPSISIEKNDACKFLTETKETFDIIFLDPPFAKNYLPICINAIENSNVLEKEGLLYLESGEEIIINKSIWQEVKSKKTGQVIYSIYKKL
jgi:16S rRNA (guanine966-N2)-methyltransferase